MPNVLPILIPALGSAKTAVRMCFLITLAGQTPIDLTTTPILEIIISGCFLNIYIVIYDKNGLAVWPLLASICGIVPETDTEKGLP
jgi:hypothetical protein